MQPRSLKRWLGYTGTQTHFLAATLAAVPEAEEVSPAAWIVGVGFIVLEAYFFAAILRAWKRTRHDKRRFRWEEGQ